MWDKSIKRNFMPTLVDVDVSGSSQANEVDLSITLLGDESTVLFDDDGQDTKPSSSQSQKHPVSNGQSGTSGSASSSTRDRHFSADDAPLQQRNVAVDEFSSVLSTTIEADNEGKEYDENETILDAPVQHDDRKVKSGRRVQRRNKGGSAIEKGPNQLRYLETYHEYVQGTISDFQQKFPNRLRDYRSMSLEEKKLEQSRVIALLTQLKIRENLTQQQQGDNKSNKNKNSSQQRTYEGSVRSSQQVSSQSCTFRGSQRSLDDSLSPIVSVKFQGRESGGNSICGSPQLSPSSVLGDDKSIGSFYPDRDDVAPPSPSDKFSRQTGSNHESDPVEIVRAHHSPSSQSSCFVSPERALRTNPNKRMASTSAKRGADLVRQRYNEDVIGDGSKTSSVFDDDNMLALHMKRLSMTPPSTIGPKDLFAASQSPISPRPNYGSSDDDENSSRHGGGGFVMDIDFDLCPDQNDTIASFATSSERRRYPLREAPVNVSLKPGAAFHLNKLQVKRSEARYKSKRHVGSRRRLRDFPDPFSRYDKRGQRMLSRAFDWVCQRTRGIPSRVRDVAPMVLFSLRIEQVISLGVKILLNDEERSLGQAKHKRDQKSSKSKSSGSSKVLEGSTVIVTRSKDDATRWESALREGTGCSVLNHATMPLSERIRSSTAEKASQYDTVLTTYDALKSPDVAIALDGNNHAKVTKSGGDNGWFSSRSTGTSSQSCAGSATSMVSTNNNRPQKCKQLSVLHRVKFQRIIFVDVLGRKCFLAKQGTSRASASIALNGQIRYVPLLCLTMVQFFF